MKNNIKFSQEEAAYIFKQHGFILIDNYVNNFTHCLCLDSKGYKYKLRLDNLQSGCKPILWGQTNIDNLEYNLRLFLSNIQIQFDSYKIVHSKQSTQILISLICTCGNIFVVPLTKLVNHKYKYLLCNECKKKYHPSGIKRNKEEYIKEFYQMGYIVLNAPDKITPKTKLDLIDKYGFYGISTLTSCKQNKHFATFDINTNRKNFIYNANLLLSNNNIDTQCCNFVDKTHLEFQCGCGQKFIINQKQFRSGKYRCDTCTKKFSSLELIVKNFLELHKIDFICQYRYDDCCDKLPLPFDFYLPKYNTLIEIDGKQHFYPSMGGNESFEIRQKHDNIKNQYCLNHNIPLIRIPYTEFNSSENWKNYLIQFIKE